MESILIKEKILSTIFVGKLIPSWQSYDLINISNFISFLNDNLSGELDYEGEFIDNVQIRNNGNIYAVFKYQGDDDQAFIQLVLDEKNVRMIYS